MSVATSKSVIPGVPAVAFRHELPPLVVGAFDLGGVLYHAKYLELLELAREAFLVSRGCSYGWLMDSGCHVVVVDADQHFHASVRYGQRMAIGMWASEIRRSTFVLEYEMRAWPVQKYSQSPVGDTAADDPGQRVHTASTRLACVKPVGPGGTDFRPVRLPQPLREALTGVLDDRH